MKKSQLNRNKNTVKGCSGSWKSPWMGWLSHENHSVTASPGRRTRGFQDSRFIDWSQSITLWWMWWQINFPHGNCNIKATTSNYTITVFRPTYSKINNSYQSIPLPWSMRSDSHTTGSFYEILESIVWRLFCTTQHRMEASSANFV